MTMANTDTNNVMNDDIIAEEEKNIENNEASANGCNNTDAESDAYANIDVVCAIVNNGKNTRRKEEAKAAEDAAMQRKLKEDEYHTALEARKRDKLNAIIKTRKKIAAFFATLMTLCSALCSTCVIAIAVWTVVAPTEWTFAVIMCAIGMISTMIHTWMYSYIKEEIFRK